METDFRVTVRVNNLNNAEYLGNLLEKVLVVLDSFPTEVTPGPQPGYVVVTYIAGNEELHLRFTVTDGEDARAQDLHGAEFIEALQTK